MNRGELVGVVAGDAGCDPKVAGLVLQAAERRIMQAVKKGEAVSLTGFGTFERRERRARTARNIRTGQPVRVRATKAPAFRPGLPFRGVVAGRRSLPPLQGASTARSAARSSTSTSSVSSRAAGSRSGAASRSSRASSTAGKASGGRKGSVRAGSTGDLRRGSRSRG